MLRIKRDTYLGAGVSAENELRAAQHDEIPILPHYHIPQMVIISAWSLEDVASIKGEA
jgi:hypothetical protein